MRGKNPSLLPSSIWLCGKADISSSSCFVPSQRSCRFVKGPAHSLQIRSPLQRCHSLGSSARWLRGFSQLRPDGGGEGGGKGGAQERSRANSLQIAWKIFLTPVLGDSGDIRQKQTWGHQAGCPTNAAQHPCLSHYFLEPCLPPSPFLLIASLWGTPNTLGLWFSKYGPWTSSISWEPVGNACSGVKDLETQHSGYSQALQRIQVHIQGCTQQALRDRFLLPHFSCQWCRSVLQTPS